MAKDLRTKACDLSEVLKVIKGLEDLPTGARQMMTDGLPHSVASSDGHERHAFQKEFVNMVRTTLEAALAANKQKQTASKEAAAAAEKNKIASDEVLRTAAEAETAAKANVDEKRAALEKAKTEAADAADDSSIAQSEKKIAIEKRTALQGHLSQATGLIDGPLRMLKEGGWQDEEMRDSAADGVDQYLKNLGAESALIAAAPHALGCAPDSRVAYDCFVVDSIADLAQKQVKDMQADLERDSAMEEDSGVVALGMWALADCARERQVAAALALETAESELSQSVRERKKAENDTNAWAAHISEYLVTQTLEEQKASNITAAIEATDRLIAGEYKGEADDVEMTDARPALGDLLLVPTPCAA